MFDSDSKKRTIVIPSFPWLKEKEILTQVGNEYLQGYNAVVSKRKKMEDDLKLYYVAATKKDKVNVHTIYTTMQTYMSVYYNDKSVVEFEERSAWGKSYADNLNRLYEFDYDEMDVDKLDYQWAWDAGFHWVGLKVTDWWDNNSKTPISKIMSPLSWVPDPQGWFSIESHRWCGFQTEVTKNELGKSYSNVDLINTQPASEQEQIRIAYQEGRDLSDLWVEDKENAKYSIYHHYTRIKWEPFLITTANEHTLIIRMMKIAPVFKEEKKDNSKILYPISLKYYAPLKGDPFGVSLPDLLRDKQSAESKLFNLTLISATRNALGDDKLYNPKKIKNIRDLQTPTIGGKYIAANVNEGESLGNAIMQVPKENPTALPFNIEDRLSSLTQLSTGINANTMGVWGMQNMTAAESQSIQKNANLRFILGSKVQLWGEKDSVHHWLRSYIYNLSGTAKKVFKVTKVFGSSYFELSRKDFITEEDLRVRVRSRSEIEEEKQKYKNDLYGTAPQILADPNTPKVGKNLIKRKMLDFWLFSEEDIAKMTLDIDEETAKLDIELLNVWEDPQEIQEGQDHLTYISEYYAAEDSDKKWEAIQSRKEAYMQSMQKTAQDLGAIQQAMWEGGWTTQNIASSNAASRQWASIQQEAKQTASLQDV